MSYEPRGPSPGTLVVTLAARGWRITTSLATRWSPSAVKVRSSIRIRSVSKRSSASRMNVKRVERAGSVSARRLTIAGRRRRFAGMGRRSAAPSQRGVVVIAGIVARELPAGRSGVEPALGHPGGLEEDIEPVGRDPALEGQLPDRPATPQRLLGEARRGVVAD